MDRIDSHHHFWFYDPHEYRWIDNRMEILRRNFLPEDFEPELRRGGISGIIPVQAHQSWRETWQLLQFANDCSLIKGVIGWIPLIDSDLDRKMPTLVEHPKLKGIRHNLQDEPDPNFMLSEAFNRGVSELHLYDLAYDILIFAHHLPQTIRFVDRHPNQVFVLDHIGKPRIIDGEISSWRFDVRRLAERPNVFCKLSGLVTEADWTHWTPEELQPYFDVVLEAFTPDRLMFGSDWPVCLLAASYEQWANVVAQWLAKLTPAEQARIWAGTARQVYRLSDEHETFPEP